MALPFRNLKQMKSTAILSPESLYIRDFLVVKAEKKKLSPNYPQTTPKGKEEQILALVTENPNITRKELAEQVGLSVPGVRYHLQKLSEDGILEYVGTSRNGYWKVNQ